MTCIIIISHHWDLQAECQVRVKVSTYGHEVDHGLGQNQRPKKAQTNSVRVQGSEEVMLMRLSILPKAKNRASAEAISAEPHSNLYPQAGQR